MTKLSDATFEELAAEMRCRLREGEDGAEIGLSSLTAEFLLLADVWPDVDDELAELQERIDEFTIEPTGRDIIDAAHRVALGGDLRAIYDLQHAFAVSGVHGAASCQLATLFTDN